MRLNQRELPSVWVQDSWILTVSLGTTIVLYPNCSHRRSAPSVNTSVASRYSSASPPTPTDPCSAPSCPDSQGLWRSDPLFPSWFILLPVSFAVSTPAAWNFQFPDCQAGSSVWAFENVMSSTGNTLLFLPFFSTPQTWSLAWPTPISSTEKDSIHIINNHELFHILEVKSAIEGRIFFSVTYPWPYISNVLFKWQCQNWTRYHRCGPMSRDYSRTKMRVLVGAL